MSEWLTKDLGSVANIAIGGTPSRGVAKYWAVADGDGECWISIADLRKRIVESSKERITLDGVNSSNVKRVPAGTLIMSFKLSIGRAAIAGCDLYTNEAIAAIIPKHGEVEAEYLYYILPPKAANAITDTAVKGSTLNKKTLGKLLLTYPKDGCVQKKIAKILQAIDETIEQTEALIEKYSLVKAGMMHDLFTRGLTPDGKLRPPREEAPDLYKETPIGWIPKDWDFGALNSIIDQSRPIVYGILMPGYGYEGGVPVVKVKDIKNRKIDIENLLLTSPKLDHEYRRSRLKPLDILLTIRGTVGRICLVPDELEGANITQDTARIAISDGDNVFFSFYFETDRAVRHFSINTLGGAVQGINLGEVRKTPAVIPPNDEQLEISKRVVTFSKRLSSEEKFLEKLRKQKAGLMHDLLTGDVPVAVNDPEAAHV